MNENTKYITFTPQATRKAKIVNVNPLSGAVAETLKLLCNSSYGYQIMDRSIHTITKYLNDEKTQKESNEPLFKGLNTVQKNLYQIELLELTIEHEEPI